MDNGTRPLSEGAKSMLFMAIEGRKTGQRDILDAIARFKPSPDDTKMLADKLLSHRKFMAAAELYAEIGAKGVALSMGDKALESAMNLSREYCTDVRNACAIVEAAGIFAKFGGQHGVDRAMKLADECRGAAEGFRIGAASGRGVFAGAAAQIYGILKMHKLEAEMYEAAMKLSGCCQGSQIEYVRAAIAAHRKSGNYKRVAELEIQAGDVGAGINTFLTQVEPGREGPAGQPAGSG